MMLLALPTELLIAIITYLSAHDILAFCQTCRFTRDIFLNSSLLKYLVALDATEVVDVSPPRLLEAGIKLSYLLNRELLWQNLDVCERRLVIVPVTYPHSHVNILSAGVYVLGEPGESPDVLRSSALRYIHLPICPHKLRSLYRPQGCWTRLPFISDALNIGLSLEDYNLLAILTAIPQTQNPASLAFQLHFRSFTTGEHHPLAADRTINVCELQGAGNHCIGTIDIAGPYLLLLLTWLASPQTPDRVYVYNWKEGSLFAHFFVPHFTYRAGTFLSENTFVLANLRQNCIEIMRLVEIDTVNGKQQNSIRTVNKFALPALRTGCSLVSMTCRTDPIHVSNAKLESEAADCSMRSTPLHSSQRSIRFESVLRCDPNKSLVQFKMYIQNNNYNPGQVANFSFVTHRETLLHYADRLPDSQGEGEIREISWDDWGPHTTRWSSADEIDEAWSASVAGQRQAVVVGEQPRKLRVRDYNLNFLRRVKTSRDNARDQSQAPLTLPVVSPQTRLVTESNATYHQGCFLEDVMSSLPYVEMESDREYTYDGILIDDTNIIGLTESNDGSIAQLDIFTMSPDEPRICGCI